jgi:hypothetical protein
MAVVKRVGHLILDYLRRLTGVLGIDDDLHVREVGQGVDRRAQDGVDAADGDEQGSQQDQETVPARPFDDFRQHVRWPNLRQCPA